jgi:hypothetical protein
VRLGSARVRRWLRGRVPAISARDAEIVDLRRQLKAVKRADPDTPSYRAYIYADRRVAAERATFNKPDRADRVTHKLRAYSFAQSHGVAVPRVFAYWDTLDEVDLDGLPDEVVVKSNVGSDSRGVLPLRRSPEGWAVVSGTTTLTSEQVVDHMRGRESEKQLFAPYFAEEFLGAGSDTLPIDFKAYVFYGEISHVLLRSVGAFADRSSIRFRAIRPDGTDLGAVCAGLEYDSSIPIPENLEELLATASSLSRAVPRPFIRVDLYDIEGKVVFGELTPRPGGGMEYVPDEDVRLGHLWERAQARLSADLVAGASTHIQFGPHPRELLIGESERRRFDAKYD